MGQESEAPTVSVAMATYNGAAFLHEQLGSLMTQSVLPTELVVSDDASSDSTLEVLQEFARSAPFRVTVQPATGTVGYARNFERALRCCSGDIVFFADQDDVWLTNKIERVVAVMDRRPDVHLVIHDRLIVDESLRGTGVTSLTVKRSRRTPLWMYVAGSATAVRRPLAELALPFPELGTGAVGHDEWVHHLARALDVAVVLQEPLMLYRRHGDNFSRSAYEPYGGALRSIVAEFRRATLALSTALSGSRRTKLLAQYELQLHLQSRLQQVPAGIVGRDPASAAARALELAEGIARRLEVMGRPRRFGRIVAADRARRDGVYADAPNGVVTLALDVLAAQRERVPGAKGSHGLGPRN